MILEIDGETLALPSAGADMRRFDGQVAIVTGAGGDPGLGRSYALLLAKLGAKVVVNDLGVGPVGATPPGSAGAEATVREIVAAGGKAIADGHSVADIDDAEAIVRTAIDTWGRVDILINNAAVTPSGRLADLTVDQIRRTIDVHVWGHIWMCRAVWPHMLAQSYGRIVNVSSSVPMIGTARLPIYSFAKLGVIGFTRALAADGNRNDIRVNALCPLADTLLMRAQAGEEVARQHGATGLISEAVAPVAALLAHRDVPFSGKALMAEGSIREAVLAQTKGITKSADLTIEALWDALPQVLDRTAIELFDDPAPA